MEHVCKVSELTNEVHNLCKISSNISFNWLSLISKYRSTISFVQ